MKRCWTVSLVLILALGPPAHTAPVATPAGAARTEIEELLDYVLQSGCQFYRNGSWYDSKRAQAHLRYKYERLLAAHQIAAAEDFIEKAASGSSLSGRPYEVRCGAASPVSTSEWLVDELARYRAAGAPRSTRGAPPR